LEDAAIGVENWLMQKASAAFRAAINNAIVAGTGNGQPQGLLTAGGIPRCLTSEATPAGTLTWQDAFMLLRLFGWPLIPTSQLPSVEPGAIPLIALNPKAAYTLVTRRSTSLQVDPYSFGYCTGFKFDARVGGGCTCPNAARALVIQ
jgi:predicted phage gp36 major capsid-like protein